MIGAEDDMPHRFWLACERANGFETIIALSDAG
jgi:hypothetical protein